MPQIDKKMKDAGYLIIDPSSVMNASRFRKPGYLEEFLKRAEAKDNVFYMTPDDYRHMRENYNYSESEKRKLGLVEQKAAKTKGKVIPQSHAQLIQKFLKEPKCPVPEWDELFEAYKAEEKKSMDDGCVGCQLTAVRKKYERLLVDKILKSENG